MFNRYFGADEIPLCLNVHAGQLIFPNQSVHFCIEWETLEFILLILSESYISEKCYVYTEVVVFVLCFVMKQKALGLF